MTHRERDANMTTINSDITVTVTKSVAEGLLDRAGFTRDTRGRWRHDDGRDTWATDEALTWALPMLAEETDTLLSVRRTEDTTVYEHKATGVPLAEVVKHEHQWHISRYGAATGEYEHASEDSREVACGVAYRHAIEIATAI
jgi:hypothetical protein